MDSAQSVEAVTVVVVVSRPNVFSITEKLLYASIDLKGKRKITPHEQNQKSDPPRTSTIR